MRSQCFLVSVASGVFAFILVVILKGLMASLEAFIYELAHKGKHADTPSNRRSLNQNERVLFGFLLNYNRNLNYMNNYMGNYMVITC